MTIEVEPAADEDVPLPSLPSQFRVAASALSGRMEGGLAHLTHDNQHHMARNPVVTHPAGHTGHLVTALSALLSPSSSLRRVRSSFCWGPLTKSDFPSFAQRARLPRRHCTPVQPIRVHRLAQRCERATSVFDAGFRELAGGGK